MELSIPFGALLVKLPLLLLLVLINLLLLVEGVELQFHMRWDLPFQLGAHRELEVPLLALRLVALNLGNACYQRQLPSVLAQDH